MALEGALRELDRFYLLILDIAYVAKDRAETSGARCHALLREYGRIRASRSDDAQSSSVVSIDADLRKLRRILVWLVASQTVTPLGKGMMRPDRQPGPTHTRRLW